MADTNNTLPALTDVFEAHEIADGETFYLTCDEKGLPCDPEPVVALRHSTSGAKVFVPRPEGFMGLDDYGLAYRGAMRVGTDTRIPPAPEIVGPATYAMLARGGADLSRYVKGPETNPPRGWTPEELAADPELVNVFRAGPFG